MPENYGKIKISPDVIASLVSENALKVEGVCGYAANLGDTISKNILGKENANRGIKADNDEEAGWTIDLFLIVEKGAKIPDVAWHVQKRVTDTLKQEAGVKVKEVNIHVQGVHFENAKDKE
jgi:uncharacterized alkaline shock family protein YloU